MGDSGKIKVAILGATGAVGQRFVQMLSRHPRFEPSTLAASERSAGKAYGEAVHWILPGGIPEGISDQTVLPTDPERIQEQLVFSALDSTTAKVTEAAFRRAGRIVVSNASSFRMDPEVPLVIPEINGDHLSLVQDQKNQWGGAIVTNPNCSTIGLCLALEPLRREFGIRRVLVTTLQALSGAGHPGHASLDVLDNVLPEIRGEEEKLESEPAKIFGTRTPEGLVPYPLTTSAQCNRVPVRDGHLLSISVELEQKAPEEAVREAFMTYRSPLSGLGLHLAPESPVVLRNDFARPQPLLDRDASEGMAVTVGRLRECPILDYRFAALVHNTIRGAAGGTLLIAEVMAARGLV